jgi:hypothetical protein
VEARVALIRGSEAAALTAMPPQPLKIHEMRWHFILCFAYWEEEAEILRSQKEGTIIILKIWKILRPVFDN